MPHPPVDGGRQERTARAGDGKSGTPRIGRYVLVRLPRAPTLHHEGTLIHDWPDERVHQKSSKHAENGVNSGGTVASRGQRDSGGQRFVRGNFLETFKCLFPRRVRAHEKAVPLTCSRPRGWRLRAVFIPTPFLSISREFPPEATYCPGRQAADNSKRVKDPGLRPAIQGLVG